MERWSHVACLGITVGLNWVHFWIQGQEIARGKAVERWKSARKLVLTMVLSLDEGTDLKDEVIFQDRSCWHWFRSSYRQCHSWGTQLGRLSVDAEEGDHLVKTADALMFLLWGVGQIWEGIGMWVDGKWPLDKQGGERARWQTEGFSHLVAWNWEQGCNLPKLRE